MEIVEPQAHKVKPVPTAKKSGMPQLPMKLKLHAKQEPPQGSKEPLQQPPQEPPQKPKQEAAPELPADDEEASGDEDHGGHGADHVAAARQMISALDVGLQSCIAELRRADHLSRKHKDYHNQREALRKRRRLEEKVRGLPAGSLTPTAEEQRQAQLIKAKAALGPMPPPYPPPPSVVPPRVLQMTPPPPVRPLPKVIPPRIDIFAAMEVAQQAAAEAQQAAQEAKAAHQQAVQEAQQAASEAKAAPQAEEEPPWLRSRRRIWF